MTVAESFRLDRRVAVITGGAGLLGQRHAQAIAEAGGIPVLLDIDAAALDQAVQTLRARGLTVPDGLRCDITQLDAVSEACRRILAAHGRVDILINNAANNPKADDPGSLDARRSRLEHFPMDRWHQDIAVGLTGAMLCSRVFGAEMARQQRGVILNIASDLALIAPDQRLYRVDGASPDDQPVKPVTYSVVKAGLVGLTRYLATYWGPSGVRVNAICPGGVQERQDDVFLERIAHLIPLGRMARPDEYNAAVVFLVSDASAYMTGAIVPVDGGEDLLVTEAAKPAVLLAPGALYLFWTTGVFYVFELAGEYDLILLVEESYRQSAEFRRLTERLPNLRVYYVPNVRPVRRLHDFYATEVRRIVEECRPRFVLSNDIWGMEMSYLFHFARRQGHPCSCFAIQASNWLTDVGKDLDASRDQHALYYQRTYRLPRRLALWLVTALMHVFRALNIFVYPAIYTGRPLRPWRTLVGPGMTRRDSVGRFDAFLYYTDAEGDVMRGLFDESCRFQKTLHPLRSHEAAARGLLGAGEEEAAIIILPSYVSVFLLQMDLGLTEEAAIEALSSRWIEIITHLRGRFVSYPVRWKIHPQFVNDRHWKAVTERIRASVPAVEALDPSEKAERLIFEHRVIVGEISTVLMWGALLRSKIVVSFDTFGVKYREMAGRENIWYFDDLSAFERASFEESQTAGAAQPTASRGAPTVREYFARVMSGEPLSDRR